jgi:hypothetical protein
MNRSAISKLVVLAVAVVLMLSGCGPGSVQEPTVELQPSGRPLVKVYKSPTCDCCGKWGDYMDSKGFPVEMVPVDDIAAIKKEYNVPAELQSCHTAIVDGYVIEGHVPAEDIERLLAEKPDVVGLAVPGMPMGAPGMEVDGVAAQAYDVLTFDAAGKTTVWSSHKP